MVVAVLFWSGAGWLGAGVCAKVEDSVAAAKAIASKLFFILFLLAGSIFPVNLIFRFTADMREMWPMPSYGTPNAEWVQQGSSGATSVSVSRELANAPHWQAAVSATYRDPRGPFARIDVTGMGGYYFDLPPNFTTSKSYGLLHGKIGWQTARWSAYLSGRNLLNKRYPVRGFYFGDVPPNFPNEVYIQLGDPRTWVASVSVKFGEALR